MAGHARSGAAAELPEEEQQEVQELKKRDSEVRRHEQAHLAAAGQYAKGGAQFEYTRGPDGRQYATGGEVSLDTGPARSPEQTILKAQIIRKAALAPAKPSGQDRRVAAQASQMEAKARRELAREKQEETAEQTGKSGNNPDKTVPASPGAGKTAGLQPENSRTPRGLAPVNPVPERPGPDAISPEKAAPDAWNPHGRHIQRLDIYG
jgi:hypothetical protein